MSRKFFSPVWQTGSGVRNFVVSGATSPARSHRDSSIAFVTSFDYYLAMNTVRIADLKSRLSEYLRKVRSGRSLTVLDRDTPIARILPYEQDGASLKVRSPLPGAPKLSRVTLPPPLRLRRDIVSLLLEERQGER